MHTRTSSGTGSASSNIFTARAVESDSDDEAKGKSSQNVSKWMNCRRIVMSDLQRYLEQVRSQRVLPVLSPSGTFMAIWRPITSVGVLAAVAMAPFDLAFDFWTPPTAYKVFGKVLDVFFLLDVALHFNIGFIDHGRIVYDRWHIARQYAKTWLLADIVSNFPVDWFVGSGGKSRKMLKLIKIPKILRFIKLLRVLKSQMQYVGVLMTVGGITLIAHYYTCFWALSLLSDCDTDNVCPDVGDAYLEGFSVSIASISGSDAWDRFMYLGGDSHLAAGRGQGEPVLAREDLMAGSMMLVGFVMLACLFANVHHSLDHLTGVGRQRSFEVARRKSEMKDASIPEPLQQKVLATYEYLWRFGGNADDMIRDPLLSVDLRRRLALSLYGPTLRRVPMFRDVKSRWLKCFCQKVEVRLYTPGDLLVLMGEVGSELFIIMCGSVEPVDEDGNVIRDIVMGEGQFFGEICFLHPGARRTASIRCIDFCKVMVLTLEAFKELHMMEVLEAIRAEAQDLQQSYVSVKPRTSSFLSSGSAADDDEQDADDTSASGHVRFERKSYTREQRHVPSESSDGPCLAVEDDLFMEAAAGSAEAQAGHSGHSLPSTASVDKAALPPNGAGAARASSGTMASQHHRDQNADMGIFRNSAICRRHTDAELMKQRVSRRSNAECSDVAQQCWQSWAPARCSRVSIQDMRLHQPPGPGPPVDSAAAPQQPDVKALLQAVQQLGSEMSHRMGELEKRMGQMQGLIRDVAARRPASAASIEIIDGDHPD